MAERSRRYRQAALGYLALGILVILLHLFSPDLVADRRWKEAAHLVAALPFLLLFAAVLAWGDRMIAAPLRLFGASSPRARGWGERLRDGVAVLLTFTAVGRTLVFAANGFGWSPRIRRDPMRLELDPSSADPLMFVSAFLTMTIAVLLARAWVPLRRGRH